MQNTKYYLANNYAKLVFDVGDFEKSKLISGQMSYVRAKIIYLRMFY